MGKIGLGQQGLQARVPLQQLRRAEQERFGQAQQRLDLRVDAGLGRHAGGRLHQRRQLVDVGTHEAQQSTRRIGVGQADGTVQSFDSASQAGRQSAVVGFVLQGHVDTFAHRDDVHGWRVSYGVVENNTQHSCRSPPLPVDL
ncbi:hypothetical protein D3C78_1200180 [compost metagenome]